VLKGSRHHDLAATDGLLRERREELIELSQDRSYYSEVDSCSEFGDGSSVVAMEYVEHDHSIWARWFNCRRDCASPSKEATGTTIGALVTSVAAGFIILL
jgi:hypothetical protein